jgi:hypothetical protein
MWFIVYAFAHLLAGRAGYPIRGLARLRVELELGLGQEIVLGEPSQACDFKPVTSSSRA